jgi:hypothetical protein
VELFIVVLLVAVVLRSWLVGATSSARAETWLTIFVSIVVQAIPFVVLGTVVSAAIAALVPPAFFARALPRRWRSWCPRRRSTRWCWWRRSWRFRAGANGAHPVGCDALAHNRWVFGQIKPPTCRRT